MTSLGLVTTPATLSPALELALGVGRLLRGDGTPEQVAATVRGNAPHCVVGWPDQPAVSLTDALHEWTAAGLRSVWLALPVPGDPCGLAGPAGFNAVALEAGEAVVLGLPRPVGLVPVVDARTLVLRVDDAGAPAYPDHREAGRQLRRGLVEATQALVDLDVASWGPEIPDLLLNARRRARHPVPSHWDAHRAETFERALLCREITGLALADDGGAVSAWEMERRRASLRDLDALSRRALVAVCSDSLDLP